MYHYTLATLALVGVAAAQTTIDLPLLAFDDAGLVGSVITSVGLLLLVYKNGSDVLDRMLMPLRTRLPAVIGRRPRPRTTRRMDAPSPSL